jgi:DNA polymerase-3 subunit gamma/tau
MTLTRVARRKPILSVEEVLQKLQAMEERLTARTALPLLETPLASSVSPRVQTAEKLLEDTYGAKEEPAPLETREYLGQTEETPEGLPEGVEDTWRELVSFAKKKRPPLASILEHASPLALNGEGLEIGYPEKSFYLERMQEADNRATLGDLCSEFFKRPMRVRVSGMGPNSAISGQPGREEKKKGQDRNSRRNRQEEALNHPLVKEAISIFGGRVVEIKLL